MPTVYIRKDLYDTIVKSGNEPSEFTNRMIEEALKSKPITQKRHYTKKGTLDESSG